MKVSGSRGGRRVVSLAVFFFLMHVATVPLLILQVGFAGSIEGSALLLSVVRITIAAGLAVALSQGWRWARLVVLVVSIVLGIRNIFAAVMYVLHGGPALLALSFGAAYLTVAALLAFDPYVRTFFASSRADELLAGESGGVANKRIEQNARR